MLPRTIGIAATLCLLGCSDDTGGPGKEAGVPDVSILDRGSPDRGLDQSVKLEAQPDTQRIEASKPAPKLTSTHTGWKKPKCLGCHGSTATYPHAGSGYRDPDCVSCHDYNGATNKGAHAASGGCLGCHGSQIASSHDSSYKAPDDCATCHYQP